MGTIGETKETNVKSVFIRFQEETGEDFSEQKFTGDNRSLRLGTSLIGWGQWLVVAGAGSGLSSFS